MRFNRLQAVASRCSLAALRWLHEAGCPADWEAAERAAVSERVPQHVAAWVRERRAAWQQRQGEGEGVSERERAGGGGGVLGQGQDGGVGVGVGEEAGGRDGGEGRRVAGLEAGPAGCGSLREALALRVQGEVRRRQQGAAGRRVP